jgi:hypothetical protein
VFILTANQSGEFSYRFQVSYQDDWGIRMEDYTLQLVVSPSNEIMLAVIVLIVLAIAGGIAWYFWKNRGAS